MDKRKQTLLTIYAGVFVAGFLINALLGGSRLFLIPNP